MGITTLRSLALSIYALFISLMQSVNGAQLLNITFFLFYLGFLIKLLVI